MEIDPDKTHSLKIKTTGLSVEADGLPAVCIAGVLLILLLLL